MNVKLLTARWLASVCALCLLSATPTYAESARADGPQIDQLLRTSFDRYHLASITAEVRAGGRIIYAKSLGYADLENRVPATPQSLYAMGSMTKSLTAHAILTLVSEGKLRLSSKLGDVLPDYKGPARVVTILQLLTHTSGIPDYAGDSAAPPLWPLDDPGRDYTEQDVVSWFKTKPLVFRPGTSWQYSNSGFYMLSLVIERITGRSYGNAIHDLVTRPFGLSHMVLGRRAPIIMKRVMGYDIDTSGHIQNAPTCSAEVALGAGGYFASADDLTQYVADLLTDRVPRAVHQMMLNRVALPDGTKVDYLPAALVESNFYGHRKFEHGGGYFGFKSDMAYYPDDRIAVVVLTNTDSLESQETNLPITALERRISRVILGIPAPRIVDLPLSRSQARDYVGTYRMREFLVGDGDTVHFLYTNNSLWIKVGSGRRANWFAPKSVAKETGDPMKGALQLLYQGRGRFVEKDNNDGRITFIKRSGRGHVSVRLGGGVSLWPFTGEFVGENTDKSRGMTSK